QNDVIFPPDPADEHPLLGQMLRALEIRIGARSGHETTISPTGPRARRASATVIWFEARQGERIGARARGLRSTYPSASTSLHSAEISKMRPSHPGAGVVALLASATACAYRPAGSSSRTSNVRSSGSTIQ